jgi:5-enolpyruvylshikimate-3-phosphate synthase
MRTMILAAALLLPMASCTTVEKIEQLAEKSIEVLDKTKAAIETVQQAATTIVEVARAADTDGDGKLSWAEVLAALAALLGGGSLLANRGTSKVLHARVDKTKGEVDELWDDLHKPSGG